MSTGKLQRADSSVNCDETTIASSVDHGQQSDGDNVHVGVRIRPSIHTEEGTRATFVAQNSQVLQFDRNGAVSKAWRFDHVFGSDSSTKDVYVAMAKGIVEASITGYNGVVFAYGQTASGKTFTLFGNAENPGLVPLTVQDLGRLIGQSQKAEYLVKLSYIELYNENIIDLLQPKSMDLKIQVDPMTGPYIANLSEEVITDWDQVTALLRQGEENRHFASTNMNDRSSRSHVLVRFVIESRTLQTRPANPLRSSWGKDKPTHSSSLHLVDLAGSERQSRTGAEGVRLKEGANINRSLLTLGTVISKLSSGNRSHIPYRDSKLTRLLSSALGGNAKTAMITCISPADCNTEESISTLRFATRAKSIVNHAQKNELDKAGAVLEKYQSEIAQLRSELSRMRDQGAMEGSQSAKTQIEKIQQVYRMSNMLSRAMRRMGTIESCKKAKEIRHHLNAVVYGRLDAEVMLEEYDSLIQQLPPHLRSRKGQQPHLRSAAADDATLATSNADTLDDALDDGYSEAGSWSSAYSDEELLQARESLESALLACEDLRCRYVKLDQTFLKAQRDNGIAIEATNRERNRLKDQLASVQDKVHSLNMEIETLNRKLHNQDQQFEDMQRSTQSLQSTLHTQLDEERQRTSALHNENDRLRQAISDKETDCERLGEELEHTRQDLSKAKEMLQKAREDEQQTRFTLRAQIESLRLNMSNLMQQDGEKTAFLNAELQEVQEENVRLQSALNEYKNKSDQQAEYIAKLQRHNNNLLAEAQQSKVESQKFRQVVEATKQKLTTTNMELTKQQTRTKLLSADLDDSIRKFNAATQSAEQDLQERNERIRVLEETLTNMRAEHIVMVEDLQQRLQLSQEQVAEAAARWEHERGWLRASLADVEKRLDRALEAEKDYRVQVVRMESNNKELLSSLTRERDELRVKLEESETLLNELADFTQAAFQQLMQPKEPLLTPRVGLQVIQDGVSETKAADVVIPVIAPRTPTHRRASSTHSVASIGSSFTVTDRYNELDKRMADFEGFYDDFGAIAVSTMQLAHEFCKGQQQTLRQLFIAATSKLDVQIATTAQLIQRRASQTTAETEAVISQQMASIRKLEEDFHRQLEQNLALRAELTHAAAVAQEKEAQMAQNQTLLAQLRTDVVALERNLAAANASTDQERKNAANWKALCSQYKHELTDANEKCLQSLTEMDTMRKQVAALSTEKRRLATRLESLQGRDDLITQVSGPTPQSTQGDHNFATASTHRSRGLSSLSNSSSFIPSSPFIANTYCVNTESDDSLTNSLESARALLLEDRLRLANEELRLQRQSMLHQAHVSLETSPSLSRFRTTSYFTPSPIKRMENSSAR